ncbi:MAG: DoxX family protein [Marinomonas colpomeniae]
MNTLILVILILELTLFFIASGSIKILGWPKERYNTQLGFFSKFGLSQNMVTFIGAAELFGGIALWLPNYAGIVGVWVLCAISAMVIYGHIRFGSWKNGLFSMATFALSGWILYIKSLAMWA